MYYAYANSAPLVNGIVQGRSPAIALRVDVWIVCQKAPDQAHLLRPTSHVQRRVTIGVPQVHHLGILQEKPIDRGNIALNHQSMDLEPVGHVRLKRLSSATLVQ